jgi:urease accessory protein
MEADSKRMRGDKPFVFTNLKEGVGVQDIIGFIVDKGMLGV